ncbi:uncharacterized protein C3orf20 homolog [Hyla sarda]|uniref:uncharacterized protein C3orf20 homolog n=1 Tax=Hyla sarda TaxID=327740 RepID=UPI0024C2A8DF|nr:uncharacterized protein C3orf20 homolog [Hyla sarda]
MVARVSLTWERVDTKMHSEKKRAIELMKSMMLKTGPLYFYDQLRTSTVKRTKKVPEELPSDMKYMNINPRLASFINSLNKSKKGVSAQAEKKQVTSPKEDKLHKEKYGVLPEIGTSSFVKGGGDIHNRKLSQGINDEDQLMNPFEDYKYVAPTLLYELGKLLHFFSQYEIVFPQGLVNVLNYSWQELIEGAIYPKKQCQSQTSKKTTDTSAQMAAEENDYKVPANPENVDNAKNNKNKANTTLMEGSKEKAVQDHSQAKPKGSKSPPNIAAHLSVTISFSMSSRVCEDKGWISQTNESKSEDMEWKGLISWALERLQIAQIQINKELSLLNEKGFCKPVILRYYETTKKDLIIKKRKHIKPSLPVLTNGKPHIPDIIRENSSLRKLHYSLIDGSTLVYYPSGHLAVCHSHSGLACGGFYTNIFSPEQSMLGTFTPFGHGSLHSPESNVFLLQYNQVGGLLTSKEGETMKEWDWPKKGKLSDPFTVQVNEYVSVKIAGQYAICLIFRWQHETVRLSLSPILDVPPPQMEDLGQLMTSENFSSRNAREMTKANKKKAKDKDAKRSPKKTTILAEIAKTLVIPEDHISPSNDFNAAVELRKLHRKIRNIVDDWMEHYRLASGIDSPHIQKMSDAPPKMSRKRKVQSAAAFPVTSPASKSHPVTETDVESALQKERFLLHGRFLSAPAHHHNMKWNTSLSSASPRPSSFSSMKREQIAADSILSKSGNEISVNKSGTFSLLGPLLSLEQDEEKLWHPSHYACPVVLQKVLLGEERSLCRCSSHQIPHVTDLEFDQLINKTSSLEQVIVVCIVSSLGSEKTDTKDVLDQLYEKKNRYRSMPCIQSRVDSFRIFKYDINTCNILTGHKQPLLVQRHNVAPGMILMYICGKLVFANYIFNGYSRSIKDLQKQITKTRSDYQTGCHLPKDFKFSYEGHMAYTSFDITRTSTTIEKVYPKVAPLNQQIW